MASKPYPTFKWLLNNVYGGSVNVDSATTLQTTRSIYGNQFDGSADVTGAVPVTSGGTGSTTALTNNKFMVSSGGAIVEAPALTDGQLYIGRTGNSPLATTITAGSGINVTNGSGTVTISSTDSDLQPTTDGQLVIGKTGQAPVLANLTAGNGISITNGPGTVTIAQNSQTGSSTTNVFNHVTAPYFFTAVSPLELTPLNTAFTTVGNNQNIVIRCMINFECNTDAVFFLKLDGVEIGSSPIAGARGNGIAIVPFDNDTNSTMSNVYIQYSTIVALPGSHSLTVNVRSPTGGGIFAGTTGFALNRTINGQGNGDNDLANLERAASNVSIDYVNSTLALLPAAYAGTAITNIFNVVNQPFAYGASNDIHITALDTTFATVATNQDIIIRVMLNFEAHWDACFYIQVDGVEVDSPTSTGTFRSKGVAVVPFDNDQTTTMANVNIQGKYTVPSTGSHILTVGIRAGISGATNSTGFYLNRTGGDGDNTGTERASSTVSIDYVNSTQAYLSGQPAYTVSPNTGLSITGSTIAAGPLNSTGYSNIWGANGAQNGASATLTPSTMFMGGTGFAQINSSGTTYQLPNPKVYVGGLLLWMNATTATLTLGSFYPAAAILTPPSNQNPFPAGTQTFTITNNKSLWCLISDGFNWALWSISQ